MVDGESYYKWSNYRLFGDCKPSSFGSLSGLDKVLLGLCLSFSWLLDLHYLVIGDPTLSTIDFEDSLTVLVPNANNSSGLLWFYIFVDDHVNEPCSDSIADSRVLSLASLLFIGCSLIGLSRVVNLNLHDTIFHMTSFLNGNFKIINGFGLAILDT